MILKIIQMIILQIKEKTIIIIGNTLDAPPPGIKQENTNNDN